MSDQPMYHEGMRYFQDRFDTRRLSDRLEKIHHSTTFDAYQRKMIERSSFFFLATSDKDGWPDCSYKGGDSGFVRVIENNILAFPSYDGNGMFRSLGNIRSNPKVGMLFIDFERPKRLRVNGTASVNEEDPLLVDFIGAQLIIRVTANHIFPNCPRYIHSMETIEASEFVPQASKEPPVPDWKRAADIIDSLPTGDPAHDQKK
jgi:uncharacterized protein